MPTKSFTFDRVVFKPETFDEAFEALKARQPKWDKEPYRQESNAIRRGEERWVHDTDEEFYADYRKGFTQARISKSSGRHQLEIEFENFGVPRTTVSVTAATRQIIDAIFEIFERRVEASRVPSPPPEPAPKPVIFIGHGNDQQWRDLKDHLHDQHGYEVQAYEVGARAGHTIRDILSGMLTKSSFAILVMTGEDKLKDGSLHPRLNVVHELGLFQGRLGFSKAVVLLEAGAEPFSNIQGIHQIRFSKKNIKETFGEVLATLRREFHEEVQVKKSKSS